jgi:hypothetical protein
LSVATPVQVALPRLLAARHAFVAECRERLRANLKAMAAALTAAPGMELLSAEAGWYACVRVPRLRSEEELVLALLAEDDVVVHPGYFFDFAQEAYLVLSLIVAPADFARGLERIVQRCGDPA